VRNYDDGIASYGILEWYSYRDCDHIFPEVEILGQQKESIFLRSMENGSANQVIVTANQDGKNRNMWNHFTTISITTSFRYEI